MPQRTGTYAQHTDTRAGACARHTSQAVRGKPRSDRDVTTFTKLLHEHW